MSILQRALVVLLVAGLVGCGTSYGQQPEYVAPASAQPTIPAGSNVDLFGVPKAMYYLGTRAIGNTAPATVTTDATRTLLLTLDLGVLQEGDLISVDGFALLNKGPVSGDTLVLIRSSDGSADSGQILFSTATIDLEDRRFVPAGGREQVWLSSIGRVVKGGPITLTLQAASANSESFAGPSQIQLRAYAMRAM